MTTHPQTFGTAWPRAAAMIVLAASLLGGLVLLMANRVVATSFTVQGSTAEFSSSRVAGQDVGFGMAVITTKSAGGSTASPKVLSAGFGVGSLDGLCMSQKQTLPLGSVTIMIVAGDGDPATTEISANNVQFDVTSLRGSGQGVRLDGIVQIGVASSDITTVSGLANPLQAPTGTGYWGIDATAGDLSNLRGSLYDAQINGAVSLPNLKITVTPGGAGCAATALPH